MVLILPPKDASSPVLGLSLGLGSLFKFAHKFTFLIDTILQ